MTWGMRLSRTAAIVLAAGTLAVTGCGGTDDADDAAARQDPVATTQTAATTSMSTPTVATATATQPVPVTTTATSQSGGVAPPAATTTAADAPSSGGTTPPVQPGDEGGTAATPPTVDGDAPTITVREDGTARATAGDAGQAEIWCDNARQGSYDAQLGQATTLVIALSGSDEVQRCELPR
jgi:hypothetical protein